MPKPKPTRIPSFEATREVVRDLKTVCGHFERADGGSHCTYKRAIIRVIREKTEEIRRQGGAVSEDKAVALELTA